MDDRIQIDCPHYDMTFRRCTRQVQNLRESVDYYLIHGGRLNRDKPVACGGCLKNCELGVAK